MGIRDGAADGLQSRLVNVGVRASLAFAIGQVAYLPQRKRPSWVAVPIIPKSEITWLVSQYEKVLRNTPPGVASITLIHELAKKIFGANGEEMFLTSYPEFSEDNLRGELGQSEAPSAQRSLGFSLDLLQSDLYWDGSGWVSARDVGPGTDETRDEAIQTSFGSSVLVAKHGARYFYTPRNYLGKYSQAEADDKLNEVEHLSFICHLVGPNGKTLPGFLLQSEDRLGFFDENDLMVHDLNDGSPFLFQDSTVSKISCLMDESLIQTVSWDFIEPVKADGKFELLIQLESEHRMRLAVRPEDIITDGHRSRFFCAMYFLKVLDRRLATVKL